MRARFQVIYLLGGGLFCLLLVAIALGADLYVSREHAFYWSDYAGYQNITYNIVSLYRESPLAATKAVARSMFQDYNALFSLPVIPFILIFGETRVTFVVALAVVYLLPFTLLLAGIATKLIPGRHRAVFWSTAGLALLTPMIWVPTLRGYPDTGAACLVALAFRVYLVNTRLEQGWQRLLIGVSIALAILFRRHFVYAGTAFFGTLVFVEFVRWDWQGWQHLRQTWQNLLAGLVRIGLTGLTTLAVLVTIGLPFVYHILTNDFATLYASYEQPVLAIVKGYAESYGWIACFCAVLGLLLGALTRTVKPEAALVTATWGGLSLLQWALVVGQLGEHYTLHFTSIVILGIAALGWTVWLRARKYLRGVLAGVGICYLVTNMIIGLTPLGPAIPPPLRSFWAADWPPLMRADYDEVARLIGYLRALTPAGQSIYVTSSSELLNKSLVINAEHDLYGWDNSTLTVLSSPQIDSRDAYPLEMLLQAQIVVVVDPFQHHLGSDRQQVVKFVYDLFTRQQEIARDFERLQSTFALADGAVASVYKRTRPTSLETALRTLRIIQAYVPARPGGQLDWVALRVDEPTSVDKVRNGTYSLATRLSRSGTSSSTTFLYVGLLAEKNVFAGQVTLRGAGCGGATLQLSVVNAENHITALMDAVPLLSYPSAITIAFPRQDTDYLLLNITSVNESGTENCLLSLDQLKVTAR